MQSFWLHKGWLNWLLRPVSGLFGVLVWLRRFFYHHGILFSAHPGVLVIIVGNITVGGSGKTPFVIWLVQWLKAQGYQPGVVSRGYGRKEQTLHLLNADSTAMQAGDEPLLVFRKTGVPVAVASDRLLACQSLLKQHPEVNVLIADDGLQHYRLQRDVELVMADATGRFGNGWLLPAGPLREPVARLSQVDALILSQRDVAPERDSDLDMPVFYVRYVAGEFYNLRQPAVRKSLADLAGNPVEGGAGIARPEAFFNALETAGLSVRKHICPDHHEYRQGEIDPQASVIMTEKDAGKCRGFAGADWWAQTLELHPDPALETWLVARLNTLIRT